jgi:hypothetical protein
MASSNLTFDDRLNNALLKSLWLQRDFADFAAFNPVKFTTSFVANYQAAYQAALLIPSDENLTDIGTQKTEVVAQKMEVARNLYQRKFKYFLEEAFSTKMGILNSFGYNDYQTIRSVVSGMISFLTNLEVRCTQEKTALLAVGISNSFLTELKTVKKELITAYTDQQTYFGNQKDMTQIRKATFEKMDQFVKEVCRVGKALYEGINEAKYSNYVIYQTRLNSKITTQTLLANTEKPILSTGADENINLQLENLGNTDLLIYVNNQLETTATGYLLKMNNSTLLTTNALSAGGYGMLIARNPNPMEGKLRVKWMEAIE